MRKTSTFLYCARLFLPIFPSHNFSKNIYLSGIPITDIDFIYRFVFIIYLIYINAQYRFAP
ncbi:hypothetical protein [Marinifilum sp. N1E240]|uniref:hypothetical protein n=1 Tax=Marinifilum sp. N1E240 TaxID=2608082 RepID=UPI00128DFA54|nr:hypothetical protein [Marinifilum sp. N1E240]